MMQYCENCMAMKQSVALVDNNNIKKTRKNMDNNTNRINSLNANRLNSQTSNGRAQSRTSTSRGGNAGTQSSGSVSRTPGGSSDYGVARSATQLRVGDIVKGEISDLRGNEITVTLDNNTILKGYIEDSSKLSIGQTAAFSLSSPNPGQILLSPVKNSYSDTELNLINKALEEAGLPNTEHNQATVKALMDNLLPINKESIQSLMQQAYDCKTEDFSTLAIMKRLMMDINEDTVSQFSSYRHGTYHLIDKLSSLSSEIPDLLSSLSQNADSQSVAAFGEKLISILFQSFGEENNAANSPSISFLTDSERQELMDILSNTAMTEDTLEQLENGTLSLHDALTILRDSAGSKSLVFPDGTNPTNELFQQTLLNIDSTLESATDISKLKNTDLFKNIPTINENAPINETTETSDTAEASEVSEDAGNAGDLPENTVTPNNAAPDSKIGFAAKFLHNITESAKNSINSMLQQSSQNADNPQSSATNTVIDTLCEKFQTLGRENDYLSTFLDKDARTELLNTLSKLPISRSLIVKIVSGNASAKEVLTVIKNVIPLSEPELISELFKSQSFEALFSKVLQSTWTLSPQKLKDGENINSFYNKMHEQLKDFESLIKSNLSGQDSDNLGQNARDAQSNIEFMKTLSEAFSYFQMPLKLKNQDAHGDLYVYTKKEKLRKNLDNIHVLLHLDMENLGALDVYLDKNHNEITTKFISDNDKSIDLLATNADMLKDALNSQGYACHVKIEKADASTSTIDEFINTKINTQQTTEMKRFSFDIRA